MLPLSLEKLRIGFGMIHDSAPCLTRLHVNISCEIKESDVMSLVTAIQSPLPLLQNLKCIQIHRDITGVRHGDGRLTLLQAIKSSAPNIEEVYVSPWPGTQLSRITPVLHIFKDTTTGLRLNVDRNINFLTYVPSDWLALLDPNYKLTQFSIRLIYEFDKVRSNFNYDRIRASFRNWLESHSETLCKM